ncbi:hypothetical protein FALBO_16026 [Fusarium albosuccineum]|uniref:Uncharacterized protein n=1 Tax=Fusarium albosuccineum TaxID=1237068 RepID=A0A8H4KNB0_9HYPO|nr:hypothetical protein FALBO_16026 [Fusarium albosuccineum]
MRFSLTLLPALAAVSYGWMMSSFETDEGCHVDNGRYRTMESTENPSTGCQRFGGSNEHMTCSQYEDDNTVGPVDCGTAIWNPRSVAYDGNTTVNGVETGYSCKFYTDSTCGEEWKNTQDADDFCFDLGLGPKSFICKADE